MSAARGKAQTNKQEGEMGKWARYYDFTMTLITFGKEKKLRQDTIRMAQLKPGDRVLEVGCGTGTLTLAAKAHVGSSGEVAGIDIAPEMIAVSRRKAARKGADVTFLEGSIASIPFPENRFDCVICSFMIFHMPEDVRKKGVSEIHRVLKPGGHLFILDAVVPEKKRKRSSGTIYDVRLLAPVLQQNLFTGIEMQETIFGFLGTRYWFLRGKADKAVITDGA